MLYTASGKAASTNTFKAMSASLLKVRVQVQSQTIHRLFNRPTVNGTSCNSRLEKNRSQIIVHGNLLQEINPRSLCKHACMAKHAHASSQTGHVPVLKHAAPPSVNG